MGHCTSTTFVRTDDAVRGKTKVCYNILYQGIGYFASTTDHQSPQMMDNGIRSRYKGLPYHLQTQGRLHTNNGLRFHPELSSY